MISTQNRSGAVFLTRPLSTGVEEISSNKSAYPLTQPIPKLDALGQTSGK